MELRGAPRTTAAFETQLDRIGFHGGTLNGSPAITATGMKLVKQQRILNLVSLASATGKYGGPYETSMRQAILASHAGYQNVLFAGVLEGDEPTPSEDTSNIRMSLHPVRRILPVRGFVGLHSIRAFRALVSEVAECDVAHIAMARELIPFTAVILSLLMRKKLIIQTHGMMTSRTSKIHRLLDLGIRPILRRADSIIALTSVEAEELGNWFGNRHPEITILGNPLPASVNPREAVREPDGDVVFIARLHPRKRVDLYVGAAALAAERGWTERYAVVGPDEGDLPLVTNACSRLNNLSYEGTLSSPEVTERVRKCDIFVLSSENEPWGNVLAIALAFGIPVVVPESAALADRIRTYGAGVVAPDNDSKAIAESVHNLLSDPEAYSAASSGARQFSRALLSSEKHVAALRKLYSSPRT
jgi:glycosyltransferase involved in cell wall biosynthesis